MIDGGGHWHFKVRTRFLFFIEPKAQLLHPIHFRLAQRKHTGGLVSCIGGQPGLLDTPLDSGRGSGL